MGASPRTSNPVCQAWHLLIEGYERSTRAFTEAFLAKHSVPGGQQQGLEDAERSTGKCGVVFSPPWLIYGM